MRNDACITVCPRLESYGSWKTRKPYESCHEIYKISFSWPGKSWSHCRSKNKKSHLRARMVRIYVHPTESVSVCVCWTELCLKITRNKDSFQNYLTWQLNLQRLPFVRNFRGKFSSNGTVFFSAPKLMQERKIQMEQKISVVSAKTAKR